MPFSSNAFDHYITKLIELIKPVSICDIGPGAGKYAHLIKEAQKTIDFRITTTAIEIDASYVADYGLRDLYDSVIVDDALAYLMARPRLRFDLTIIGDCIEHMKKSDGIDLLNFLVYRTGYICVVYPDAYVQDDWQGHLAEAHISTWGPLDFQAWKTVHHSWEGMHLFLVRGYQPAPIEITS